MHKTLDAHTHPHAVFFVKASLSASTCVPTLYAFTLSPSKKQWGTFIPMSSEDADVLSTELFSNLWPLLLVLSMKVHQKHLFLSAKFYLFFIHLQRKSILVVLTKPPDADTKDNIRRSNLT